MTINQAVELVRIFWPKDKQKEFHDKIMPLYPEKKWFLLMIGSPKGLQKNKNFLR